jgi:uncharacterized protein involved in cysteine biosynthesis
MKPSLPHRRSPNHPSYQLHRKQVWTQVLLPILLATLILAAVIVVTSVATFRDNGDVARWAAIATMWLTLPVMFTGLVFLIILIAMIYLIARLTGFIPPYSYQAQSIFYRIEGGAKRIGEMARRPMLLLQELGKLLRASLKELEKRI